MKAVLSHDLPGTKRKSFTSSGSLTSGALLVVILSMSGAAYLPSHAASHRGVCRFDGRPQVFSLDGTWEIAEGSLDAPPSDFSRKVTVPGLVSLASPPFVEPGPKVADRRQVNQKDPRRDAFWYRRAFVLEGRVPDVARIKVSKAMFGKALYINGRKAGEHVPSFTPGWFNVRELLRVGTNDILIRVGADRDSVTRAVPSGFDFEKEHYIPGIFDSVTLHLSGSPHIIELQAAPDITNGAVLVQTRLGNDLGARSAKLAYVVREAKSGRAVARAEQVIDLADKAGERAIQQCISLPKFRLWSPEQPFLYRLEVDSGADFHAIRFGMRDFRFDPQTRMPMLNGKPYFMRGSNITLYRFFEDPECGTLPWNKDWVRRLHLRMKDMNWNCLRYCIGFPPESWYDIADEVGILIQDEFPIWFGGKEVWPQELKTKQLALEYAEWMRDRWNHPCVVIWDANNETVSDQTGPAIAQVRGLDLSGRPWDNSYEPPAEPGDVFESHPYHFVNPHFRLSQLATADRVPRGNVRRNEKRNPVVINEYGWLWLNRDGTPTTLTSQLYANLLGTNSTTAQRREVCARYNSAETEFWRAHRQAAAVMHFTSLGYSRSDGQTSDHWLDVANLVWEPNFYREVKDAFEPVGLMIDFWREKVLSGSPLKIPVIVINDLPKSWEGRVVLTLAANGKTLLKAAQRCGLEPYGATNLNFAFNAPGIEADCSLVAELKGSNGRTVRSRRMISLVSEITSGLAYSKPVRASSVYEHHAVANAVDEDPGTYWSSEFSDPAWIAVDLGSEQRINRVQILWERAFAKHFRVETSSDGENWSKVYETEDGKGGTSEIEFPAVTCRWVRVFGTQRATQWGYAIHELKVFPAVTPSSAKPK